MKIKSWAVASLAAVVISTFGLVGCSAAPKDDAAGTATKSSEKTAEVEQSEGTACALASAALETAFTEYGGGMPEGTAVEASVLLEATQKMSKTLTDAGATITNSAVSGAFSRLIDDVAAMVATNEEQIKAKAATGSVPDELNDSLEEQTNNLNTHVGTLESVCS